MQSCRRVAVLLASSGVGGAPAAAAAGRATSGSTVAGQRWSQQQLQHNHQLLHQGKVQPQQGQWRQFSENSSRSGSGSGGEDSSGVGRFWRYLTGNQAAPRRPGNSSTNSGTSSRAASEASSEGGAAGSSGASGGGGGGEAASGSSSSSGLLVPNNPESRYREVLAVPLAMKPLFPGGIMPVTVTNNRLIKELMEQRRQGAQAYVGAFMRRSADVRGAAAAASGTSEVEDLLGTAESSPNGVLAGAEADGEDPSQLLHSVGTFAQVHTIVPHDQGAQLLLLGHRRIEQTGLVDRDPLRVSILHLKEQPYNAGDDMLRATTMELISTLKELLHMHPLYNEQMRNFIQFGADFHDLSRLSDLATSLTSGDSAALQAVLQQLSVPDRAHQALVLLKKEVELCRLQADIGKRVEEKINKDQRRYFLMEQLKSIKKELGLEKDEKTALVQKFRERLEPVKQHLPEAAEKVIEEELEKLQVGGGVARG
ncbi:hypothetical protein D9Q98_010207 [Chlorella vulgaris]|uniref:Lon N-terminal domain-containing protein n=1 Tax=Chlorella vulgaris TaxID=3077 RepID=A0A9D4TMW0_CHLVU|nr:hypothetical protein D9Q98_010207 [Chlorella vulgaris]